jgi:5'-3' exonuclease
MGVRNLWPFLEHFSEKLGNYQRFQERIVAIDFSLWIYQLSYLSNISNNKFLMYINLFRRLCKLIQHRIKPIFVFDSVSNEMKKRTIRKRYISQKNLQKRKFADTHKKLALKLLGQIGKYEYEEDSPLNLARTGTKEFREPSNVLNLQSNGKKKNRYQKKNIRGNEPINSLQHKEIPNKNSKILKVDSVPERYAQNLDIVRPPKEKISRDSELIFNFKLLISSFGFPFLDAPGEAEAQCAYLQRSGSVDFIITDDSDVFLYGGSSVCRNFLKKKGDLLLYNFPNENSTELIFISLILGNDYLDGIKGLGLKSATKILKEIKENIQVDGCFDFVKALDYLTNVYKIDLNKDFILNQIYPAFSNPLVKEIGEDAKFAWVPFDKEKIRTFLTEHTNWESEKISKEIEELTKLENTFKFETSPQK